MKEENKSTGNVTNTSEIEVQPKTKDRRALNKLNSWADIHGGQGVQGHQNTW